MNTYLIIANGLTFLTFIAHTFGGDIEYKYIEPKNESPTKMQSWTMGRGAFHIVSIDFLLATTAISLINFSDFFSNKSQVIDILSLYFFGYGLAFLITLIISKRFPKMFLKLSQWLLLWVISGFIYLGNS